MREIQRAVRKALDWYASRCFQVPIEPSGVAIGFLRDELGRIPTPAETGDFELQWRAAQGDPWLLPHDLVIADEAGETRIRFPNRHEAAWEFGEEVRRRARRGGSYLLSIVMAALVALVLGGCSPVLWKHHAVTWDPGMESFAPAALAGWNQICPGVFDARPGETRVVWGELRPDRLAEQRGYVLLLDRGSWVARTDLTQGNWTAIVAHELGHVLLPYTEFPGVDGEGHYPGGVMRATGYGAELPNAADRRALIVAGYDCTGGRSE